MPQSAARLKNGNTLFRVSLLGVFEVNPSGNMVWRYNDSDLLANGNTLVGKAQAAKGKAHVLEIAPDKKVVWSWDGLAQYDRPPYSGIEFDGWIHANAATRMANGLPDTGIPKNQAIGWLRRKLCSLDGWYGGMISANLEVI